MRDKKVLIFGLILVEAHPLVSYGEVMERFINEKFGFLLFIFI